MTLRELYDAFIGREKSEWSRTSLISCILANSARDPAKQRKPFVPDDFNPYAVKRKHTGAALNKNTLALFAIAVSSMGSK